MKKHLTILAVVGLALLGVAFVPSLTDFDTTQFDTSANLVKVRNGASITNASLLNLTNTTLRYPGTTWQVEDRAGTSAFGVNAQGRRSILDTNGFVRVQVEPGADGSILFNRTNGSLTVWIDAGGNLIVTNALVVQGNAQINGRLSQPPTILAIVTTNVAVDASLNNNYRLTLTGTCFLQNPTNPTDGQKLLIECIQDGTGSRTLTFGTKWAFGTDITGIILSTAASKRDFITAYYNLTSDLWYITGFVRGY